MVVNWSSSRHVHNLTPVIFTFPLPFMSLLIFLTEGFSSHRPDFGIQPPCSSWTIGAAAVFVVCPKSHLLLRFPYIYSGFGMNNLIKSPHATKGWLFSGCYILCPLSLNGSLSMCFPRLSVFFHCPLATHIPIVADITLTIVFNILSNIHIRGAFTNRTPLCPNYASLLVTSRRPSRGTPDSRSPAPSCHSSLPRSL